MPHVILDTCLKDGKCTKVCQRKNIHPREDEPDFANVKQVFINPKRCLDCGSCAAICETKSSVPKAKVPPEKQYCIQANADYYKKK